MSHFCPLRMHFFDVLNKGKKHTKKGGGGGSNIHRNNTNITIQNDALYAHCRKQINTNNFQLAC